MSKVYISIALYNGKPYLPDLFHSINDQTFRDFTVIVIDNASSDGGADWIRRQYPEVVILRNHKNLGFAKAHNQAIELARKLGGNDRNNYVLVANQDLMLDSKFLEEIVDVADRYKEFGVFGGKILKMFKANYEAEPQKSNIIDTTGLIIRKSRRIIDRGVGEEDGGQYEKIEPVFGISGTLVLYRISDLARSSVNGDYFDSAYFMYKEDVDLAWRMNNIGIQSLYAPRAIAYHYRGIGLPNEAMLRLRFRFGNLLRMRRDRSSALNRYSYRNHLLTILKNDRTINVLIYAPWIIFEELKRSVFVFIFEFRTWLAGFEILAQLPRIRAWRREMNKKGLRPAKEIRKFFK